MPSDHRRGAFWIIVVNLAASIVVMLSGQSLAVFDHDLVVRLGLQESLEEVGEYGVEVNRAFGARDTGVSIPLKSGVVPEVQPSRAALLIVG